MDFDNVMAVSSNQSAFEIEFGLSEIVSATLAYIQSCQSAVNELHIRLYGGWLDESGSFTLRGQHVSQSLSTVRGLRSGVRVMPALTIALAAFPSHRLNGTLRSYPSGRNGQKMVDTMMAIDAVYLADKEYDLMLLLSDDDDLLPAAITASCRRQNDGSVHLLRKRPLGRGLNDAACSASGGKIAAHGILR